MSAGEHAEKTESSLARKALSFILMVAAVIGIAVLMRMFLFVPYEIPSKSMEDTIVVGDMVFSEKVSYYFRQPAQGDVVTFADPDVPSRTLIKRVVATGGQTVDLVNGKVTIDGKVLDEPYTDGKPSYPLSRTSPTANVSFPYTVPDGYLWVMGDNRTESQDSRYFGAIPVSSVSGRGALVYWPFNHFGLLS